MTELEKTKLEKLSYTFHDEIRDDKGQKISTWDGLRELPIDTDLFQFIVKTVLKECPMEEQLVKSNVITAFSSKTQKPLNAEIGAPTGEGKTYVTVKVLDLFPKEDVVNLVGQSNKAFFHEKGEDVVFDEKGKIIPYKDALGELIEEEQALDEAEENNANADPTVKRALKVQRRELDDKMNDLKKRKCKLITVSGKIIFAQDTLQDQVSENMMPILSHDKYESLYKFADNQSGITTRTNIIRGFFSLIQCRAIDTSWNQRADELNRRNIRINPKMSPEKYKAAMQISSIKYGEPSFVYDSLIVSDRDRELASQAVRYIIYKIKDFLSDLPYNKSMIKIPFTELIMDSFPYAKASEMTVFNNILNVIGISALINYDKRPKYLNEYGLTVIADLDDLENAIEMLRDSVSGQRPYVLEWYNEVFLKCYEDQNGQVKAFDRGGKMIYEKEISVTVEELVNKTKEVSKKPLGNETIRKRYLYALENGGLVNKLQSEINRSHNVYTPVEVQSVQITGNDEKYPTVFNNNKLNVRNFTKSQVENYVKLNIQAFFKQSRTGSLYDHLNNIIDASRFNELYFKGIGDYFVLHSDTLLSDVSDSAGKKVNITSELQQTDSNDVKSIQKVEEVSKTVGYFQEKPEIRTDSSTPEQSSSSNEGKIDTTSEDAIDKICPYCNEKMKPTEFMDHVIKNHDGYSLFPSIEELNLYKMTHGVKKTG